MEVLRYIRRSAAAAAVVGAIGCASDTAAPVNQGAIETRVRATIAARDAVSTPRPPQGGGPLISAAEIQRTTTPQPEPPRAPERLSAAQQTRLAALDHLLTIFSRQQKGGEVTLEPKLVTPRESYPRIAWAQETLRPDQDLLKIEWAVGGGNIAATLGEAEIKSIRAATISFSTPTTAEKANGLDSREAVKIQFVYRLRLRKLQTQLRNATDLGSFQTVNLNTVPPATIPFSQWQDGVVDVSLFQRGVNWESSSVYTNSPAGNVQTNFPLNGYYAPRNQCPGSCQAIIVN